jgi:hypothetical protein
MALTSACLAFLSLAGCINREKVAAVFLAGIRGKNGLQIHNFADLTYIIAKIWQCAQSFSRIDGFSPLA